MVIGGNITIASNPSANLAAPVGALGREPVGEESRDNKNSVFKPVEQATDTDAGARINPKGEQREQGQQTQQQLDKKQVLAQERADQQVIDQLSARDREVRNHERAHAAVGGQYASGPTYEYERGPDGVNYAVAGEVSISTGAIPGDPAATIDKAQQVKRAALAPAEPSAQDRSVAASATQIEAEARVQLQEERLEERRVEQEEGAREREAINGDDRSADSVTRGEQTSGSANDGNTQRESNQTSDAASEFNRRLVDIGAINSNTSPGNIISQIV